jgi:sigma-B regulation protein RsbU (phosphoserine phosphatase)
VAGVCGLVLLTGAVVLGLAHHSARAGTEQLTGSVFREVSGRAAAHTRGYVLQAAPVVESLAQLADKGLAVGDPDRLTPQLLGVLKANPGLTWVSYADEAGTFTGVYRTPDGGLRIIRSRIRGGRTRQVEHDVLPDGTWKVFKTDDESGYDPRTRPFYTEAKRAGRLTWLRPYFFLLGSVPGTTCAAPVTDAAGRLRGVLTADFTLATLSEFVAGVSVSEHSRVFLFTDDQVLLAHPDHRGGAAARAGRLLTLAESGDPLVDAYRTNLRPEYLRPANGGDFHFFEFRHDGTDYLGSTTTFRVGDDLVWVVGVAAPKADFVGDVWKTQALALAAAAAAVLAAVVLAFVLASAVSRPVGAMIGFMNRVGAGDLDAKAEFAGSREFRDLSATLNRMIGDLRDGLRVKHSLDVAMQVQQQLLPRAAPSVWGLDVAGHSTYCDETGGDYYDFLVLDQPARDTLLVVLGDVMGHGVASALVMAGVRSVLRDRAEGTGEMAALLGRLNNALSADLDGSRFMTMYLARLDARAGTMRWASAGHDPALVYNPAGDQFREEPGGDLPLGVMPGTEYAEQTASPLAVGQVLLVGTDGVWEMMNPEGEAYGRDRLKEVIRAVAGGSAQGIVEAILNSLAAFRRERRPTDDVTFVIIKVTAVGPQS